MGADELRCPTCHVRHGEGGECPEPGEEGYIPRAELLDAFRMGHGVCLACQSIWYDDGTDDRCPDCGRPRERFGEDDLAADARPAAGPRG